MTSRGSSFNSSSLSNIIECSIGTDIEANQTVSIFLGLQTSQPDAFIFANNDIEAAIGAMLAVRNAGINLPRDIGEPSFSNWQFSSMVKLSFSSVSQFFMQWKKAAVLLIDRIEKKIS